MLQRTIMAVAINEVDLLACGNPVLRYGKLGEFIPYYMNIWQAQQGLQIGDRLHIFLSFKG